MFFESRLTDHIREKDIDLYLELHRTVSGLIQKILPFLAGLGHPVPPPDEYCYYKWP